MPEVTDVAPAAWRRPRTTMRRRVRRGTNQAVAASVSLVMIIPIYLVVVNSLKSDADARAMSPGLPRDLRFDNYNVVIDEGEAREAFRRQGADLHHVAGQRVRERDAITEGDPIQHQSAPAFDKAEALEPVLAVPGDGPQAKAVVIEVAERGGGPSGISEPRGLRRIRANPYFVRGVWRLRRPLRRPDSQQ